MLIPRLLPAAEARAGYTIAQITDQLSHGCRIGLVGLGARID